MLTTDFTGTYEYEREEARYAAQYFTETIIPESTPEECVAYTAKIAAHWSRVLDPAGMSDFRAEWNNLSPYKLPSPSRL